MGLGLFVPQLLLGYAEVLHRLLVQLFDLRHGLRGKKGLSVAVLVGEVLVVFLHDDLVGDSVFELDVLLAGLEPLFELFLHPCNLLLLLLGQHSFQVLLFLKLVHRVVVRLKVTVHLPFLHLHLLCLFFLSPCLVVEAWRIFNLRPKHVHLRVFALVRHPQVHCFS